MAYVDNFETLFKKSDNLTPEKIILEFYDLKNIALKSEIPDKALMALVALRAYERRLRNLGLIQLADLTKDIIEFFLEFMVSRNREGRKEGERMLGALREQLSQKGVMSKLLGVE